MEKGLSSLGLDMDDSVLSELTIKEQIRRKIDELAGRLSPNALAIVTERLKQREIELVNKFVNSDDIALLELTIAEEVDRAITNAK